ncbi:hypothetical protein OBBRIDRAFT_840039 [Obba rivulosa]|uniref:DNA2/NAM7 helicase-like C-terminal domain-containing protein n=1 Tax=Obba rivulosa TaxID=1052685 RepID=A0A8E2AL63_9APHY|nr:hypothetical protein OBBRIDRAFT_840039 [Obba rivulosa]
MGISWAALPLYGPLVTSLGLSDDADIPRPSGINLDWLDATSLALPENKDTRGIRYVELLRTIYRLSSSSSSLPLLSTHLFRILFVNLGVDALQSLRADHRFRISGEEIGIIAPYNAQCRKIRMALKGVADEIKVGSVEEFQGQERRVIIISSVRSSREFVNYDLKHTLGFVANPRRFNVAVTRAKALLVVIGDPSVLSLDPLWRSFLNYVHVNGTSRPSITPFGSDAITEDGKATRQPGTPAPLWTIPEAAAEDEDADANVDRPWREVE